MKLVDKNKEEKNWKKIVKIMPDGVALIEMKKEKEEGILYSNHSLKTILRIADPKSETPINNNSTPDSKTN